MRFERFYGLQTLSAKAAAALDKELMSTGAFSIDQLMELAGLSVSQAGLFTKLARNRARANMSAQSTEFTRSAGAIESSLLSGPATMVGTVYFGDGWPVRSPIADSGGDGLVAARHLRQYGYQPTIYYPKRSKNDLYQVSIIPSSLRLEC